MDKLYQQNARVVYRFLYSVCHDKQLAEDLTQETFLEAYKSIERFDGSCKISRSEEHTSELQSQR